LRRPAEAQPGSSNRSRPSHHRASRRGGRAVVPPFAFGCGDCSCSSAYTHTAKLSMMARTNIRSSSMMPWPPRVSGHVCPPRKAGSVQVGINSAATPAPPSIPTAKTNTAVMALTSRRRLCLLDMASSLIVIPSADCPIHNFPIVTLCMKQITFRTMILRCGPSTGCAALY
jgi:hypothetical protein